MRWDRIFDDLEAQAESLDRTIRAGEVEGRTRSEFAGIGYTDRVRAGLGRELRLTCAGGHQVFGTLRRSGPDWLALEEAGSREWLVHLPAVIGVSGLGRAAEAAPPGPVGARLGLRHVLRGLARDRSGLRIYLTDSSAVDATPDRVGRDFVEVATHPAGEARRRPSVREVLVIPFAGLAAVRRMG